ncbi:palmitoyltransferase for Vac8p [Tulasnella sp. 419]|nr:palmitoyltransferase for Vac8p [Tulasnella sp. 419]
MPLLSFELQPTKPRPASPPNDVDTPKKPWTAYILTAGTVLFLLSPHPSFIKVLVSFYLKEKKAKTAFFTHLTIFYFLSFVAFTSLIVVLARDPGPVDPVVAQQEEDERYGYGQTTRVMEDEEEEEVDGSISLNDMLMSSQDRGRKQDDRSFGWTGNGERRWCQKCWAPKPERCHHCSVCGRCVLKMDHHCPWLASKCIGHRTYASFVHFLLASTLLSIYGVFITVAPIRHYLNFSVIVEVDDSTPFHVLFLGLEGLVFSFTIGSFWAYHAYLISTNQTTLESLTPFLLLRHLSLKPDVGDIPPETELSVKPSISGASEEESPFYFPSPPANQVTFSQSLGSSASSLPSKLLEHELTSNQRRLIRRAAGKIRMYDLGWKNNWKEVFGGNKRRRQWWSWWMWLIFTGGVSNGDGYRFQFNPEAESKLEKLAAKLETTK